MENNKEFKKDELSVIDNLLCVNQTQTQEDKIKVLKENLFSTIFNSSYLNVLNMQLFHELIELIEENCNILIPSLPIFRFNEEGNEKTFSFSLGVVNSDFEHGKYFELTLNEIKEYLNDKYWVFLYSISDEYYDDNNYKFKTIILNKKSQKKDGNANDESIHSDVIKFTNTYSDKLKNAISSKWVNAGFIDETRDINNIVEISSFLEIAESILIRANKIEDHDIVYRIIVRLSDNINLNYHSINFIVNEIRMEYSVKSELLNDDDFCTKFVDDFTKSSIKHKHIDALIHALITGEKNDQTKLIAGLSKLHTAGSSEYTGLDVDWLFSNYYQNLNNTLTPEEKEKENEKAFKYFIEKNITDGITATDLSSIEKLIDCMSQFTDNHNPYPFLNFNRNFDSSILKYDTDLRLRYETILNNEKLVEITKIYEEYKHYYNTVGGILCDENKYLTALTHKKIDLLIEHVELDKFIKINRAYCHNIVNSLLDRLGESFNSNVFIEKYVIAITNKKHKNIKEFNTTFINQFVEFVLPEKTIKLF